MNDRALGQPKGYDLQGVMDMVNGTQYLPGLNRWAPNKGTTQLVLSEKQKNGWPLDRGKLNVMITCSTSRPSQN